MIFIEVNEMPVVQEILTDACKKIKAATGKNVELHVTGASIQEDDRAILKGKIKKWVSAAFGIEWAEIVARSRKPHIKDARFVYCYLMVKVVGATLVDTGNDLIRDHSTIINAISVVTQCYRSTTNRHSAYIIRHIETIKKLIENEIHAKEV